MYEFLTFVLTVQNPAYYFKFFKVLISTQYQQILWAKVLLSFHHGISNISCLLDFLFLNVSDK